jgi:predicted ATPase/DNA-binding winged helix-turn-helix (wHTH) protein
MLHPSRVRDTGGVLPCRALAMEFRMLERVPPHDLVFVFGPFLLLPAQRTLLRDGHAVPMGPRAFDILKALVERAGEVLATGELGADGPTGNDAAVHLQVAALRRILGEGRSGPRYIASVPSRGYCFVAQLTRTVCTTRAGRSGDPGSPGLIGRTQALRSLQADLAGTQIVTLVGPGGIGKTSVANAAAAMFAPMYPDGTYLVDLAALTDPALVHVTAACALGVPPVTGDGAKEVREWQAERRALVVLDNCEHLAAAAGALAMTLACGGSVRVLATSREPLGLPQERVIRVAPLPGPPVHDRLGHAECMAYPAFELFVERAAASFDGVTFTDADAALIAKLCERLDGIPLAIELVAAQAGLYGIGGLAQMVEDSLTLATIGRRTNALRQQTLHDMLDWSFHLLSTTEQRLLCRLSLFRDRFGVEAAIAVGSEGVSDTVNMLETLVGKSLICVEREGARPRYRLLETTRSYAYEKVKGAGDFREAARAHLRVCSEAVQAASLEFSERDRDRWRERHLRLLDDVRPALAWAFGPAGDVVHGTALVRDAAVFYDGLGLAAEHLQWLERAAQCVQPSGCTRSDAQLLLEYGQVSLAVRGGTPDTIAALERAASIAGEHDDASVHLCALAGLFNAHMFRVDYATGQVTARSFGAAAQAHAEPRALLAAYRMEALALHLVGRHADALALSAKAMSPDAPDIGRLYGDHHQFDHRTAALTQHARMLWITGRPEVASQTAADAVRSGVASGHLLSLTYALVCAACPVALWRGDDGLAADYIHELQDCVDTHSLTFWQAWPQLFRAALDDVADDGAQLPHMHPAQRRLMATFGGRFARNPSPDDLGGAAQHWCAPELMRLRAEQALADGREDGLAVAESLLRDALGLANEQGALAWSLRCAMSLARLLSTTRPPHAAPVLKQVLDRFTEGQATRDLKEAHRLLDHLGAVGHRPGLLTEARI